LCVSYSRTSLAGSCFAEPKMPNMRIIHFHKAPRNRILSWADVSSDEEEDVERSLRTPDMPTLMEVAGEAQQPEPDASMKLAEEVQDRAPDEAVEQAKDLPEGGTSQEPAEDKALEVADGLSEGGKSQEPALDEHLDAADNLSKTETREPSEGNSEQDCECAEMRTEIIQLLQECGVSAKKLLGIGTDENRHKLCTSCTEHVKEQLNRDLGAKKKVPSTKPILPLAAHLAKATPTAQAADPAPREIRLADLLDTPPPRPHASSTSRMKARFPKKASPQFAATFFMCSAYNGSAYHRQQHFAMPMREDWMPNMTEAYYVPQALEF